MRGALLVVVAFFASGCLSSGGNEDVGLTGDLGALAQLPADLFAVADIGPGGDAETSLTIGPEGTMLACTHGGFQWPSPLFSSLDGGLTWEREDPQPNPVPSGDCDVAVTDDGSWYIVYDTIASATVAASHDRGGSWSLVFTAAAPLGGVDRPWLEADGNDVVMVWANVMVAEPAIHAFARSQDGGRTWTETRLLGTFDDTNRLNKVIGHPIQFEDSKAWRIPVYEFSSDFGGESLIEFWASDDDGATWRIEPGTGTMPFEPLPLPAVARDETGAMYMPISLGNDSKTDIHYVVSVDDGKTWSQPILVAPARSMSGVAGVWVDAFDDYATMAWVEHAEDEKPEGWRVGAARIQGSEVVWAGNLTSGVEADRIYEFLMVRHDAEGRAHVVFLAPEDGCGAGPATRDRSRDCVRIVSERESPA